MPQAVNPPVMYYQGTPYGLGGVTMVDKHSVMTMLYSRESGDSNDVITLSEDFDNFDLLVISGKAYISDGLWHQSNAYICDSLAVGNRVSIGDDGSISWFDIYDKTTLSRAIDSGNPYQITHVMGVKFNGMTAGGGKGGVDYSTDEQDTGLTWIDGREIYQRTLHFSNPVSGDATIDLPLGISGSEMDYVISRESIAERWQGDTFYDYSVDDASPVNQWAGGSFMIFGFAKVDEEWNARLSNGYFIIKNLYLTIRYVKPSSS